MSDMTANIIGVTGSILFILGFAYANVAKEIDKLWFNIVNLIGAILLLISLSVHFNLAAVILEIAWGIIAVAGIAAALRSRSQSKT
jgi:multisubunit Na+/H+ antiporter MnhB subunit